ncbi:Hypothetical predicted protein, partial [Olea europaea subsp. europaea]
HRRHHYPLRISIKITPNTQFHLQLSPEQYLGPKIYKKGFLNVNHEFDRRRWDPLGRTYTHGIATLSCYYSIYEFSSVGSKSALKFQIENFLKFLLFPFNLLQEMFYVCLRKQKGNTE